jgi:hypothetical protein
MKKLLYTLLAVSIIFSACEEDAPLPAANNNSNNNSNNVTELEGTWVGYEGNNSSIEWTFIFNGDQMDVTPDPLTLEWYLADFSINTLINPKQIDMTATDCGVSSYIGYLTKGIYTIQSVANDTILTFSACEPGNTDRPSSIPDANVLARTMILTKQ